MKVLWPNIHTLRIRICSDTDIKLTPLPFSEFLGQIKLLKSNEKLTLQKHQIDFNFEVKFIICKHNTCTSNN